MISKQRLETAIEIIEDECFRYADDLQERPETASAGYGVRTGALLALKHIRPLLDDCCQEKEVTT